MNVTIAVFSPTGNTLEVGRMLEASLRERGARVQLLDVTRRHDLLGAAGWAKELQEEIEPHDVLCVGGPVYAHHMQYNVSSLVEALPPPRGGWGEYAVPFVTYGAVSSGVALAETARRLRRSGRQTVLAMKVNARHCYSEILDVDINPGMPGEEAKPYVNELASRLLQIPGADQAADLAKSSDLLYLGWADRAKARIILRERLFHRLVYPKLELRTGSCVGCGLCVEACPVGRLAVREGKVTIRADRPACIHCGACVAACPQRAIVFPGDLSKWARLLQRSAEGKGIIASNEEPKSAVYPVLGA